MAIGVYLTKGVADTFDRMEKLQIKKVNRIIADLKNIMSNAPMYVEKISLDSSKISVSNLKTVFDKKYSDKELEDFVKIFKNIDKGNKVTDMSRSKRQLEDESTLIKFTEDLLMMLDKIDNQVTWTLLDLEQNDEVRNVLGIYMLDVSDTDYCFYALYNSGRKGNIKIGEFVRTYTGNKFTKGEILEFASEYNKIKNRASSKHDNIIDIPEFTFNPKNVRSTFISLVTETYPHGTEEGVLKYLPNDLTKDSHGNYYKVIGNSDIMFTSHLDTASRDKTDIILVSKMKGEQELIMTDGTTILGADDKAGVTLMLYLMAHNIPGVYYFFIGEERGGIGSGLVADDFHSIPFLRGIKKCVSFDRRNYYSVITSQYGTECCSSEFGESLCKEINKSGFKMNLDPTGVFTDSANFIEHIPECTNVSVGYFNEHTHDEVQNITFLSKLAGALVKVDWPNLTIKRKIGFDVETMKKYSDLISSIKSLAFYNEVSVKGIDGKIIVSIQFDDSSLRNAYDDLSQLETIFLLHRVYPDVTFDGDLIKIKIG